MNKIIKVILQCFKKGSGAQELADESAAATRAAGEMGRAFERAGKTIGGVFGGLGKAVKNFLAGSVWELAAQCIRGIIDLWKEHQRAAQAAADALAKARDEFAANRLAAVEIDSPALAHKLADPPPPILPKGGRRYLAVPADDAASLFDDMPRANPRLRGKPFGRAPHPDGGDRPALVDEGGGPVYWLIRKASTPRDPRALPPEADLSSAALSAASAALGSLFSKT